MVVWDFRTINSIIKIVDIPIAMLSLPEWVNSTIKRRKGESGGKLSKRNWKVYGCFLKWWYPQNTPKWSFLVGKPMGLLGKPTILGFTPIWWCISLDSARNASRMRRWWTYLLQIQIHSFWSRPCASDTSRMGSKVNHVENQHESPSFARSMRRLCVTLAVRCGASIDIDISVFCAGTSI